MPRYQIITTIDITRSNPSRTETDPVKIGQQSNFNSLVQAIGLRANLEWDNDPWNDNGRLPEPLEGKTKHWIWQFQVERDEIFERDGDPVALLIEDLHNVPVVTNLSETAEIFPKAFQTKGDSQNIIIKII